MIASGAQRYVPKNIYYIMQAGSYWILYRVRKVDMSLQIWISHEFNEMMNIGPTYVIRIFNFYVIIDVTANFKRYFETYWFK